MRTRLLHAWVHVHARLLPWIMSAQGARAGVSGAAVRQAARPCPPQVRDVAVWVMDEVHHCCGFHPYAVLVSSFINSTPKHLRPRILGLTATPVQVR